MALPLSHVRVVDYCQALAGPLAAMYLADQGADVIKIETAERESPAGRRINFSNLALNRNKRSIALDTAKPEGRQVFDSLVQWADVFLTNMRVGARKRRRVDYEHLAAINPRLIYAGITAFGEAGPDADLPGNDVTTQARSGDTAARRLYYGPMPTTPMSANLLVHCDMATPMLTAYAVALALIQREQTGQGQKIEINLLQTALALQWLQMTRVSGSTEVHPASALGLPSIYLCSDGRYIFVYLSRANRWEPFCRSMGLEDLLADPRFDTPQKREQQLGELTQVLARRFSTRPAAEWEATLKTEVNFVSVVREMSEVYDDPQVIANEMITRFEQPGLGTITTVNVPIRMSATAGDPHIRRHVPEKGEHTIEILEELGRTPEQIQALKALGVVR